GRPAYSTDRFTRQRQRSEKLWREISNVVDAKALVGDEDDDHVAGGTGAVLHHLAFGKPDEAAGPKRSLMRHQCPFQDVHAVAARMCMRRVDDAGWIAYEAHEHAGLGIAEQLLAIERPADLVVGTFFPGHLAGVDREQRHVGLRS